MQSFELPATEPDKKGRDHRHDASVYAVEMEEIVQIGGVGFHYLPEPVQHLFGAAGRNAQSCSTADAGVRRLGGALCVIWERVLAVLLLDQRQLRLEPARFLAQGADLPLHVAP